ncbi:hypothetical protein V2G26_016303 [Clonostachys chloroleuca]
MTMPFFNIGHACPVQRSYSFTIFLFISSCLSSWLISSILTPISLDFFPLFPAMFRCLIFAIRLSTTSFSYFFGGLLFGYMFIFSDAKYLSMKSSPDHRVALQDLIIPRAYIQRDEDAFFSILLFFPFAIMPEYMRKAQEAFFFHL